MAEATRALRTPPINERCPRRHFVRRFRLRHIGPECRVPLAARHAQPLGHGGKIAHAEHVAVDKPQGSRLCIRVHGGPAPTSLAVPETNELTIPLVDLRMRRPRRFGPIELRTSERLDFLRVRHGPLPAKTAEFPAPSL